MMFDMHGMACQNKVTTWLDKLGKLEANVQHVVARDICIAEIVVEGHECKVSVAGSPARTT